VVGKIEPQINAETNHVKRWAEYGQRLAENIAMRRNKGFTLIEILVVIAIIALLLAILMPALEKAKDHARCAVCKANLRNYSIAVMVYLEDNDDKFCDPDMCYFSQVEPYPVESGLTTHLHLRWCNRDVYLREHPEYGGTLFPYIKDARSFICPSFKQMTTGFSEDHFFLDYGDEIGDYYPWYNYTMNAYLGSPNASVANSSVRRSFEVLHPAKTYSFTEESPFVDTLYNISGLNDTFMVPGSDSMIETWLAHPTVNGSPGLIKPGPEGVGEPFWDVIAGFHHAPTSDFMRGQGNCAFLDGHISAHRRDETFPLAWPK
jgi:prepilin-type N-terminal cleavage/methylation domain-containing protein/prepilin-type processing-associated H-X9-DG protein